MSGRGRETTATSTDPETATLETEEEAEGSEDTFERGPRSVAWQCCNRFCNRQLRRRRRMQERSPVQGDQPHSAQRSALRTAPWEQVSPGGGVHDVTMATDTTHECNYGGGQH